MPETTARRVILKTSAADSSYPQRVVIAETRATGHNALRAITAELNARGIRTRRGGRWHLSNARDVLAKLDPDWTTFTNS